MKEKIEILRKYLIKLAMNQNEAEWHEAEIVIEFPPFTNKGFKTLPSFWDISRNRVRLFLKYDEEFTQFFYNFIKEINDLGIYNQVVFQIKANDYANATITVGFNQNIEDNFQNNLPKSKRGKTIPWWKNPNEV